MIDVHIHENNGFVAVCDISGSPESFFADLARIKSIPVYDREWRPEQKNWKIVNADKYSDLVVEIGDAIRIYKMQLRMNI